MDRKHVKIYTDGAARRNPEGPGGYGAVLLYRDSSGELHRKELSAGYKKTTNNRMELMAAIAALEEFTAEVTDYAPSWLYLGVMYEATGRGDDALAAYLKATETDPDDLYGMRSYATERIAALSGTADSGEADASSAAPTGQSLQDVLSGASGTGY